MIITTQWKETVQFQNFSEIFQRKEVFIVREDTLIVTANSFEMGYFVPSVLHHCTFLKKLRFEEGLRYIMYGAFSNFSFLTSVEFNEDLEGIDSLTFRNCCNLRGVKFPKSLYVINDHAFLDCFSLEKVEVTGDSIRIHDSCFSYCDALELIEVPTDITLDSFKSVYAALPKQAKLVFHGTGLSLTVEECKSLLQKVQSVEERFETVYEASSLLYPEEFVVKDFEENKTVEEFENSVGETSLF